MEKRGKLSQRSRFREWKPTTNIEMEVFLSIIFNMGLISLPQIKDYWKTTWIAEMLFFARVMSRDRFELLFWLLHVSHCEGNVVKTVDKVKLLLECLITKFQARFYPEQELAVDETVVGFRGRFGAKQYMPKKPTKWGIKCFTLADSSTGYVLNTLVYTGADTLDEACYKTLPQPARVVLQLIEPYIGCGHHIFNDRYYSSLPLASTLYSLNTSFTGTINKNRVDRTVDVRGPLHVRYGEVVAYRADHLLTLAWQAEKKKKPVIMLSTTCSAAMTVLTPPSRRPVYKPAVVDCYNHFMNGVDIADQHAVYYSFIRKTVKWWRKIVFWLIETSMVNSYILYKDTVASPKSHVAYHRSVIESLASRHISMSPSHHCVGRPRKQKYPDGDTPERLNGRLHIIDIRKQ